MFVAGKRLYDAVFMLRDYFRYSLVALGYRRLRSAVDVTNRRLVLAAERFERLSVD